MTPPQKVIQLRLYLLIDVLNYLFFIFFKIIRMLKKPKQVHLHQVLCQIIKVNL